MGDIGSFSFFGNKIITTGEGGMVTTNDDGVAEKIRLLEARAWTRSGATGTRWSATTTG